MDGFCLLHHHLGCRSLNSNWVSLTGSSRVHHFLGTRISLNLASTVGSSLKKLAIVFSSSSPDIGSTVSRAFFISFKNSGSSIVAEKAFLKIATCSVEVPGGTA